MSLKTLAKDLNSTQEALDLIVHNAADVAVLAHDQREMADMQHATAHRLDRSATNLKAQVERMKTELGKA